MKALNNKMLWSKAGFVTFNSRQKAVDFWKACGSQDLAVQGGRVIADDFHFYYVAKVGEVATKRVQDYVRFADVHGLGMHTYIAPNV